MSRTLLTLLSALLWLSAAAQQQGENIVLNQAINGGQHSYMATQSIRMLPGFSYKPLAGDDYFEAWIEESPVIFPPEGITGGDPANNFGGLPGTLPGNLMVSPSGAAVYNIPIDLPQGVGGLTPQLALVYNSQGGNGLLGMGWSLSGLSGISRSGKTIYHDGKVEGILFNNTDNYVLDGQRLMPVNAGKTEYRTEVESFMRILPQQIVGGEPTWFKVQTKSGQTLYYGKESHSRIEATGKQKVMSWLLDRIEDPLGNYVEFTYQEEGGMGRIAKIAYGANRVTGQSHVYEVLFSYTTNRHDQHKKYIGGSYLETKYLLDKIKVKRVNQQTLHHYKLDYDLDFYPRMKHVWLYKGDTETEFINPTTMELGSDLGLTFIRQMNSNGIQGQNVDNFFLDMNGDGLTDLISLEFDCYEHNNITGKKPISWSYQIRNNENGFTNPISLGIAPAYFFSHLIIGDYNGDGLDDFAYVRYNHENQDYTIIDQIAISNADGFNIFSLPNGGIQSQNHPDFQVGDFDGDGIAEIMRIEKESSGKTENVFVYKFSSANNTLTLVFDHYIDFGNTNFEKAQAIIGDFNGDGRSDLMRTAEYGGSQHTSNCFIYSINLQTGSAEFLYGTPLNGYPTTWHQVFTGDFNGDGITDILTYNYSAGDNAVWEVGLFTGSEFVQMGNVPDLGHFDLYDSYDRRYHKLVIADFNNDARSDIMKLTKEINFYPEYEVYYSNGNDFTNIQTGQISMNGTFEFETCVGYFRRESVSLVMDFNGDAYADFYICDRRKPPHGPPIYSNWVCLHNPSNTFNQVLGFTNGFGEQVRPHYQPLTNKTIYTKGTSSSYPLRDIQPPLYVVSEVARETVDYGLQTTEQYTYQGAKVHLQGKGYLGFEKRRIHQLRQNIIAEEINAVYQPQNKYFYPFNTSSNTYVAKTGFKLSETINDINHKANKENELVFFPYNNQVNAWSKEFTSKEYVLSTRTETEYDDFGNLTLQQAWYDSLYIEPHIRSSEFSHKNITGIQYISDTDNWIFLPHIIDKKSHYHNQPIVFNKTINFYYDKNSPFYPLLETKYDCIEGDPLNELTTRTDYTYDSYGNPTSVSLSAPHDPSSPAPRTTTMAYHSDYKHRLLTSTTNPLGYVSSFTYDDAYGWKLTETDPNGFEISFNPHPFGTESLTTLPDGSRQGTALRWAHKHPDAPDNATYYSWQKQTGSAPSLVFYHKTGAELRRVGTGFDGSTIYTDTYYDENNRLHKTSLPYVKEDKKKYYTTYGYDDIGRATMIEAPDGARTITQYHKTTVTTTNALGQRSSREHNAAGWLTKSTDALGTEVKYSYFSDGKLHQTMIASAPSTLITLAYNGQRQRSSLSDPNYGLMQTTYNAFGELISQTSPRNHQTTYTYDKLGRMTTRKEFEGTTTWNYATAIPELGVLQSVENTTHNTSYTYDELLRPETITENISGTAYTTSYTYDRNSRPQSITHPSGFTEQLSYNRHGYQHHISDAQTNKNLWQLLDQYPAGMTKRSATGNGTLLNYYSYNPETLRLTNSLVAKPDKTMIQEFGYDYDAIGNMTYRSKTLPGGQQLKEEFWYDRLNRLTDIKLNGQPTGGHSYDEDGLGNIEAKTADGQTLYSDAKYGEGTHGPHAITSATTTAGIFPSESDSLMAAYTSYEQLKSLTQGTLGLSIMYGHHHQRIRQKYWDEATQTATLKLWVGACEYITHNGQTTILTYLSSPDGLYALHLINPDESESIRYLHTDHLGSWTAVTDETGTITDEQSFDAWGNRRDPATWTSYNYTPTEPKYDRGFTGHEHLDGFQLINMNGRMYDPVVSRMLAPDNFVQTPDFSQNFNRYSYALNNPLMFTDPDGELLFLIPHISFSNGGIDFGLTFGVGFPGVLSAQATIGRSTGSNNTYFTVGGTASGFTASAGWGTQTGYTVSAGTGLGFPVPGFGSNLTSIGISWSQNGGMSASAFGFTVDSYGMGFNPNLGYSYGFSLNRAPVTAPAMLACDDCITLPEVVVIGSRWTVGHGPVSDNTYMAPYQFSYAPRQSKYSGSSTSYYQWANRANTLYNLYNPNPISKTISYVNLFAEGVNKFNQEDYLGVTLTIAEFLLDRNGYVTIYKTVADLANSPQTQRQVSILLQQDAQYHYQMYQRTGSTWHYNEYMRYRSAIETARSKF